MLPFFPQLLILPIILAPPNLHPLTITAHLMRQNQLANQHRHQHRQPNKRTNQMLLDSQRTNSNVDTSILNNKNLCYCCDDLDDDKELVVAEMLEDVDLPVLDLSGVDFVELLHEHKGVEEEGAVLEELRVVADDVGHVDCAHHHGDVEDQVALEHDEEQHCDLVHSDGEDVSDHCSGDQALVSFVRFSFEKALLWRLGGLGKRGH